MDHGSREFTRHQSTVRLIGAVGKDFAGDSKPGFFSGFDHQTVRKSEQDDLIVNITDGFGNGHSQGFVLGGHVVQRTVRFAVLEGESVRPREGLEGTDLILHVGFGFLRGADHVASAESHQIRIAGVRTHGDAGAFGDADRFFHDQRIAGMIAAGDVGR